MTRTRLTTWTLLLVAGFALLPGIPNRLTGQDNTPLPVKNGAAVSDVNTYKEARGIPAGELKKARESFAAFARYYGDVLVNPQVYRAPQELKFTKGPPLPTIDHEYNGILKDLDRFLLVPNPFVRTSSDNLSPKVNADNADYIRELGAALDAVLKPLIETNPERIVRINAARVLAEVCRSGASAHYPTVTALLTNPRTPTEVKHYALQAAANLLAAYELTDYKSRRHSIGFKEPRIEGDKELGALVVAIDACITNPDMLIPGVGTKAENATPEQLAVLGFVRRQAVKALGEVRFVMIPGPDGKTPIYPSYTLVRVCLSDPALVPAPGPAECAEAVIGLCHMAPAADNNFIKGYSGEAVAEAITAALITFATTRAANPDDRSLPWRGYATRLSEAFKAWPPIFDPSYEPTNPTRFNPSIMPAALREAIPRWQAMVLVPMEKVDSLGKPDRSVRVDIEGLKGYLTQLRENPKRSPTLFVGNPQTSIDFQEKK